jgi:hypothetical protein
MQQLVRRLPGVVSTRVGYSGGDVTNATYRNHGTHAEAIEVTFDLSQTSFRDLLEFFFHIHDPTTPNRQGTLTAWRSTLFSCPIAPNWVRSSSGCGTDDCGRTSATSRPSTMPFRRFQSDRADQREDDHPRSSVSDTRPSRQDFYQTDK